MLTLVKWLGGPPFDEIQISNLQSSMLSNKALIFLRELETFIPKGTETTPFLHYLTTSGGLFNIGTANPFQRFLSEATRTDLSRIQMPLQQVVKNLVSLRQQAAEIHVGLRTKEMTATISHLLESLRKAEARAKAEQEQKPWVERIAKSIGETGQSVGVVLGHYASGNWEGVAATLPLVFQKMGEFRDVYIARAERVSTEIPDLKAAIENAENEYKVFVREAADIRQFTLEEKHRAFLEILNDRLTYFSKLQNRLAQFHDLLRLTVIGMLVDPSQNKAVLRNNLHSVMTFVQDFPLSEPYFRFWDVINDCRVDRIEKSAASEGCIYVNPTDEWMIVWSPSFAKKKDFRLPIYVLAPSILKRVLPSYGIHYSIEKFNSVSQMQSQPLEMIVPTQPTAQY